MKKRQIFLLSFSADVFNGIQVIEFENENAMQEADESFENLFIGYESMASCVDVRD